MNDSNGNIISLLQRIADGQDKLREGQDKLREDMNKGFAAVNARVDRTNSRLDNMLTMLGGHHADHEQRIAALEGEVFKKSGSG